VTKRIVNPPNVAAPTGYSHAVVKRGTPVFLAGQVGLDPQGNLVGDGDAAAQTEQAFQNVRAVLGACGGAMSDVVKLTVYVTDAKHRAAVVEARKRWFPEGAYPASTYLVVAGLAVPQLLVEIDAVAMIE
jgi:enamine deaminase RidA (YjgF/YER057c/UK114 family)